MIHTSACRGLPSDYACRITPRVARLCYPIPVDSGMSSELELQFNWLYLDSNALMCVEFIWVAEKRYP